MNPGNIVRLYSDSACTRQAAEGTASSTNIDLTLSASLSDGSYSFYAATHSLTASGSCSTVSASYLLDTVAPVMTGTLNDGTTSSSTTSSPALSWSAATDTSGSGVSYYEIAIGSSSGGTNIKTWTRVADGLSVTVSALSLTPGTTYYASVRAIDRAGNASTALVSDGWLVAAAAVPTFIATWTHQAYVKAANAEAGDYFGSVTAISGDTMVVGAYTEDSNQTTITNGTSASSDNSANGSGAAYVYRRTGATWIQEAYLKAPNSGVSDGFGSSLAIDGDTVVVGARDEASNQTTITNGTSASSDNSAPSAGAVYVFKRTGVSWAQEAFIKAPNAQGYDSFSVVSVSGDTVAVGAAGEDSNQTTITNGATASSDNSAADSGAVYVFKRTGITWAQEAYIKAPNVNTGDRFGSAVSLDQDTLLVGARGEDGNQTIITNGTTASSDNSATDAGAVYVFKRTGATWAQEAYLKAANNGLNDWFGVNVSVSSDTVVVGAWFEDSSQTTITNGTIASSDNSASDSGAVYIFKRSGANWSQEAYLKATNSEAIDAFGMSVSVSGDTVAVGALGEDSNQTTITNGATASSDNAAADSGAVYVFKRTGTSWTQEAYLKAPNGEAGDYFGSVSVNGDTISVGAYHEDSNQTTITNGTTASSDNSAASSGAVYVFTRSVVANWQQQAYVKAVNSTAGIFFGWSVGVSNDTAVVGAFNESSSQTTITNGPSASSDTSAASAGAVYVYRRTGDNWAQEAYIKAPNANDSDLFGGKVAISNDTIVVGAEEEKSNQTTITNGTTASSDNTLTSAGAAYVFKRNGSSWAQEAYLKPPFISTNMFYGSSVAIDGDTIVVGAYSEDSNQTTITNGTTASSDVSMTRAGAAYVYKRTGTTWAQEAFIKPPNPNSSDYFGDRVSISGDTVVVGAYGEDSNETTITNGTTASADNSISNTGAVYVFKRTGSTWAQEAYIKPSRSGPGANFGASVSIFNDTLAVGAVYDSSNQTTITNGGTASSDYSLASAGAVFVFKRSGTSWAQEAYLKAPNAGGNDVFGASVAVNLDTIAVGTPNEDSNQTTITNGSTASSDNSAADSGAVYIFKRNGSTWANEAYLKAPNAEAGDNFGFSLGISNDTIVVGAYGEDSSQTMITNGSTASSDNSAASSGAIYIFKR